MNFSTLQCAKQPYETGHRHQENQLSRKQSGARNRLCKRVCEIVKAKKADNFVILLCTGFDNSVMKAAWTYAIQSGLPIAMNSGKAPADINGMGFNWVNLAAKDLYEEAGGSGRINVNDYLNAGINVSIYNVDKKAGDGNAVYSTKAINGIRRITHCSNSYVPIIRHG